MSEWISVKDRLPVEGGDYDVICDIYHYGWKKMSSVRRTVEFCYYPEEDYGHFCMTSEECQDDCAFKIKKWLEK